MTETEKAALRSHVARWDRAADTAAIFACSNLLFRDALKHSPLGMDCGLVVYLGAIDSAH